MTQPNPSMADLFGEESGDEDKEQSTQPSATQPDAADELNSTQPAINERDLFGSDSEDEEADADSNAAADTADPYTRRGSAVLDLEQQLAEVDEDGSALDEDARDAEEAANNAADVRAAGEVGEESQEYKRDKALAKRKKNMSSKDDEDNDSTTSSQLNEEPSRSSSNRKSKASKSSSPSPSRPTAAPITASGPPLTLLSSPAAPFAAAAKLHLVRLPNVIGVQANAFHADSYEEETAAEEAEEVVGQGKLLESQRKKSKAVSLMVENVIRWREVKDDGEGGAVRRESNTRLVRWSDGTSSLLIGNECFDVVQSTADPHRNYVYLQHTAVQSSDPDDMSDSPPPSRSRTRPLLRSVGAFTGHIKFKVTGIDSDSHRKLKDVLFETHTKKARIVIDYNEINPEKLRQEEEAQARQDDKKRSRQLARERGGGGGGGRRSGGRQWQPPGEDDFMADFLEEDDNPSEKARRRKGDYEADVARLKRAKEGTDDGGDDNVDDTDFVEGEDEQAEDEGDLDEDEILGRKRTGTADTAGEASGEATGESEATAPAAGRARAEDADQTDDLVLHGASKRRRVLADEEESD